MLISKHSSCSAFCRPQSQALTRRAWTHCEACLLGLHRIWWYKTTSGQMAATAFCEGTPIQELQDQQRGRYLVASLQIQPGSRVLCESAASAVLYDSEVPRRCHLSFELAQTPLRCAGCKHARYASKENQRSAWSSGHREECAALAACRPHVPPPTVRLIAKLFWRQTW